MMVEGKRDVREKNKKQNDFYESEKDNTILRFSEVENKLLKLLKKIFL